MLYFENVTDDIGIKKYHFTRLDDTCTRKRFFICFVAWLRAQFNAHHYWINHEEVMQQNKV